MYSKVLSGTLHGVEGRIITVEADVSDGLPAFNMVGFLASEVREASDRVRSALKNSDYILPPKKVTINLSPADVRKEGAIFDLAIAISFLASCGYIMQSELEGVLLIGELSLNGELRGVHGVLPIVDFARKQNIHTVILPEVNCKEASYITGMNIFAAKDLKSVVEHFMGIISLKKIVEPEWKQSEDNDLLPDFSDIRGQELMKRATEIAVTGMHNILLMGPPGAGKSMLAKRIPSIMPPLTYEESIEITKIYSSNGMLGKDDDLIRRRPFRSPHHSITANALIGGGIVPKPGEISLAHRGVLFLDEFLEFSKNTIEMMRQPIEDGDITISRLNGSYTFPCDFMLVAAMNPCPCGYYPDLTKCSCNQIQIERYLKKISQPMLDRMDMNISVRKIEFDELYSKKKGDTSAEIRKRVVKAQTKQRERLYEFGLMYNSEIPHNLIETVCGIGASEKKLLEKLFVKHDMTARGITRLLRVSRTIADLENNDQVKADHIWEAFSYRISDIGIGGEPR